MLDVRGGEWLNALAMTEFSANPGNIPLRQASEPLENPSQASGSSRKEDGRGNLAEEERCFDPSKMRKTKPGVKRLFIVFTVLLSFLLGLPFLLKSVEIYRSPLPFDDIDSLTRKIETHPILFPCRFQAIFLGFDSKVGNLDQVQKLSLGISDQMKKLAGDDPVCGTCGNNYTVKVTMEINDDCIQSQGAESACSWLCGSLKGSNFEANLENDMFLDELFESIMTDSGKCSYGGKVYTVIVVNREEEELRTVVGTHRHGWIVGSVSESDAVQKAAEIFVNVFINGAKEEGSIHGEFMPIGADGRVVLSFSLLNADPRDWIYDWDFQRVDDILLAPVVEALGPIANISIESQILYHTPKSFFSSWDEKEGSYIFTTKDLPFFVNSNEWYLDTSVAAGGRSKILHIVVYVPSAEECPLSLRLPDGKISTTNGFISPMWGGVVVWNPSGCLDNSGSVNPARNTIPFRDLQKLLEVIMGQLRQLLGLRSESFYAGTSGGVRLLSSENGFTKWELDVLSRQHTCSNLLSCSTTLGSLSRLVQSLPRMIIMDEIGKQVELSLQAARLAQSNASLGSYDTSVVYSRQARSLAEDAFYHPSIMSVSYYSFEHCFAVYSPFFLPVALQVTLAFIKEVMRYRRERSKYLAWKMLKY